MITAVQIMAPNEPEKHYGWYFFPSPEAAKEAFPFNLPHYPVKVLTTGGGWCDIQSMTLREGVLEIFACPVNIYDQEDIFP